MGATAAKPTLIHLESFARRIGKALTQSDKEVLTTNNKFDLLFSCFIDCAESIELGVLAQLKAAFGTPRDVYFFPSCGLKFQNLLCEVFSFEFCDRGSTSVAYPNNALLSTVFAFLCDFYHCKEKEPRVATRKMNVPPKKRAKSSEPDSQGVPVRPARPQVMTLTDLAERQRKEAPRTLGKIAFKLTNSYRARCGLRELVWSDEIHNLCLIHARNMSSGKVKFGHGGFKSRARSLPSAQRVCENVAQIPEDEGEKMASYALEGWINSPGHRKNLESPTTHFAVAAYSTRGSQHYFFVQIFALF